MRRLVLLAGVFTLSGCASVVSRSHANADRWYPGTKQDWRDLSIDPWYSQSLDLVDLPLSAVADTLLLPWDAIARSDHRGPEPVLPPPAAVPVTTPLPPPPAVSPQPEPAAVQPVEAAQPDKAAQPVEAAQPDKAVQSLPPIEVPAKP